MLYNRKERKEKVRKALEISEEDKKFAELKIWVCPFFKEGEYSPCIKCKVEDYDVEQCTEYFLDRIDFYNADVYSPKFDLPLAKERPKVKLEAMQDIGMTCNSCYMSEKCPAYEKHAACGIDWGDVPESNTDKLDKLIHMQYIRVKRAETYEVVDGGVPDTNLSVEMDRLTNMINLKDSMGRDRLSISVEASGGATREGGGLLSRLFSPPAAPATLPEKTEDATHIELPINRMAPLKSEPEFVPDSAVESYDPDAKKKRTSPPPRKK